MKIEGNIQYKFKAQYVWIIIKQNVIFMLIGQYQQA